MVSIFGLILTILMKISLENNSKLNKIIFDTIRLFTTQDVNFSKLKYYKKIGNETTFIILILTLIFFSFIITKCFTSLLLTTYFKFTKVPYIDSLEQLIDQDICLIASRNRTFLVLNIYKVFDENKLDILREKKEKYEKINNIDLDYENTLFNESIFDDIVNGKVIFLDNSGAIKYMLEHNKNERNRFVVSEHKYINQLTCHPISKRSIIKKQQIFGFVSSF